MHLQIGDLKGFFGLFMVHMQMLRAKMKVLDLSFGNGTGKFVRILLIVLIFIPAVYYFMFL